MARERYQNKLEERIKTFGQGFVFTATDFLDIGSTPVINEALHRLTMDKQIKRIMTGVYYWPKYSNLLGEDIPPQMNHVAEALARKYNWTIAPSGETALNMLHLSTQVPNTWTYVSDGPYKSYQVGPFTLRFKNTQTRHIAGRSRMTILLIQAIKALGKDGITEEHRNILSRELSEEDKKTALKEAQTTTRWIYEEIRRICGEEAR